jgi:glycosyltransferase involved in cell wall biosynthesis
VKKSPFISIVLPTYNRAHLLSRAIESVLDQSYPHWELIVVDDGSTDSTLNVIQKFVNQDPRIRIIKKSHSGLSLTRNAGIHRAGGEYTGFLDSDDEFTKNHLQLRADYLQENKGIDLLYGKVQIMGDPYVPDRRNIKKKIHLDQCPANVGALFIRTALLKEVGGFPVVSFSEDRALFDLLKSKKIKMRRFDFRTYKYYRTEPDSICNRLATITQEYQE